MIKARTPSNSDFQGRMKRFVLTKASSLDPRSDAVMNASLKGSLSVSFKSLATPTVLIHPRDKGASESFLPYLRFYRRGRTNAGPALNLPPVGFINVRKRPALMSLNINLLAADSARPPSASARRRFFQASRNKEHFCTISSPLHLWDLLRLNP